MFYLYGGDERERAPELRERERERETHLLAAAKQTGKRVVWKQAAG